MMNLFEQILHNFDQFLVWFVKKVDGPLWDITIVVLLFVGLFFTITTGLVQLRLFPQSIREMWLGRANKGQSLTPFQAFATGLASRVGVGNIGGVATAIALGGPGAVFWMWITALIGMSSGFAESTLAQVYKTKNPDNTFRGGPAYYITKGLKAPWLGTIFAIILIFTFGFAFNAVQSNSIVEATHHAWNWNAEYVGLALVVFTAAIIFSGVKRIGQFASIVVPFMALVYLVVAMVILAMNIPQIPNVIAVILESAFSSNAVVGGIFGGVISQAMMMGIKRGLYSNEAGMGSAPNTAATADVKHPVSQGLIQMLGVFVDTMIVCSCTAIIILLGDNYGSETLKGVVLTQHALNYHIGEWGVHFLAFILLLFCYTTIVGNYAYAESNIRFLKDNPKLILVFRLLVLFFVYFGAVKSAKTVWDFADTIMAVMALINLGAIICLSPVVWVVLKDYQRQLSEKKEPVFKLDEHPQLENKGINQDIWK